MFLVDLNLLVAVVDSGHVHHEAAVKWFLAHRQVGWSTCPLVETGFVRLLSNPAIPGNVRPSDAVAMLAQLTIQSRHSFLVEGLSVLDGAYYDVAKVSGTNQVNDAYLLALCRKHGLKLATLDRRIERALAPGEGLVEVV